MQLIVIPTYRIWCPPRDSSGLHNVFTLHYNDIGEISSSIRLFTDDYVAYRIIKSVEDHDILQADINTFLPGRRLGKYGLT